MARYLKQVLSIMDMKNEAMRVFNSAASKEEKMKLLKEIASDCLNEMDADDQNMHPETEHEIAEGYKAAKKYLRVLGD